MWHLYNPLPISVKKKIIVIGNSSLVCGSSNQKAITPDWTKSLREFHLSSVSLFKSRFHFQSWFYFQKSVSFSKVSFIFKSRSLLIEQKLSEDFLFQLESRFHFQAPLSHEKDEVGPGLLFSQNQKCRVEEPWNLVTFNSTFALKELRHQNQNVYNYFFLFLWRGI